MNLPNPSKEDLSEARKIVNSYDDQSKALSRYAFRCTVEIVNAFNKNGPSYQETLHAEDIALQLERHISINRRIFHPELEALGVPIPSQNSFNDPVADNPAIPEKQDRLRVGDKYYKSAGDSGRTFNEGVRFSDGYFNPFSAAILSFQQIAMAEDARQFPAKYLMITEDILKGVARLDKQFFIRLRLRPPPTLPEQFATRHRHDIVVGFESGLPIIMEVWHGWDESVKLISRTETRWTKHGEVDLPTSIDAFSMEDGEIKGEYRARLEWKIEKNVNSSLFDKSDLQTRFDLKIP